MPRAPPPQNVERGIYDTVDKLNKSKLTGNINVNKMVLPLVSCW